MPVMTPPPATQTNGHVPPGVVTSGASNGGSLLTSKCRGGLGFNLHSLILGDGCCVFCDAQLLVLGTDVTIPDTISIIKDGCVTV